MVFSVSMMHRAQLSTFFKKHDPNQLNNIKDLMETHKGKETELLKQLHHQYGVVDPDDNKKNNNNNNNSNNNNNIAQSYHHSSLSPTPTGVVPTTNLSSSNSNSNSNNNNNNNSSYRDRVLRMYQTYAPEKVAKVDTILQSYQGHEDDLMKHLVFQYGPEPSSSATRTTTTTPVGSYHERVHKMYQNYAPEKVSNADILLPRYAGREEILIDALVRKYGPEPGSSTSSSSGLSSTATNRSATMKHLLHPEALRDRVKVFAEDSDDDESVNDRMNVQEFMDFEDCFLK